MSESTSAGSAGSGEAARGATSETAAAPPATLLNPGAAPPAEPGGADWLPPEYRGDPLFKDFKGVDGLAKSYAHAAKLVGVDKGEVLRIPAADDAEGWAAVHAKLGRPETPDKYEFPELPGALFDGMEATIREGFHKAGLSAAQAKGAMEMYAGLVQQAEQQRQAVALEAEHSIVADLKREWGEAFDERLGAANRALLDLGGRELADALDKTILADGTRLSLHPGLVRLLAAAGERLAEPSSLKGPNSTGPRALTPAEAQTEINRLKADREFFAELSDRTHPRYGERKAEWERLHLAAFPNQAA